KPYLDRIHWVWAPDVSTSVAAFIAGQTDTVCLTDANTRLQVLGARKDVQVLQSSPSASPSVVMFNSTRKPLDDVRVRKALSIVVDQKEIGQTLYGDFNGKPLWTYSGQLMYAYPEAIPQEELAKRKYFESPKSQATLDEARKLLADAGVDR